ncbi:hypothetical protein [Streptomyces sp. 7N604]|uniref:hypothetical protein n=1 Tax=Streptomyces sp. 7N604 TaxID=3457415 RepID=UPI003FD4E5C0
MPTLHATVTLPLPKTSSVQFRPRVGLVEDAAEALAFSYIEAGDPLRIDDRRRWGTQGSVIGDALMGSVGVVELLELPQRVQQMPLAPDQAPVQLQDQQLCILSCGGQEQ